MKPRTVFRYSQLSLALLGAFGLAQTAGGANTDIANEPLSQAASGVRPNVMFILDDSGSMDWDFSPDFIDDVQGSGATPSTTAACFDSADTGPTGTDFSQDFDDAAGSITGRQDHCIAGDPPYMSPDFNKQYYNPAIWYRPGVNADGSEQASMDAASTTNWTAVQTDPYAKQRRDQLGNSKTTENLVANYPDRVWCKSTGDSATGANCRPNSAYSYPNWEYNRGFSNTNGYVSNYANVKFRFGGPYYYHMQTAQWCSTATLNAGTCVSGNAVDPNLHVYIAPEFCTDAELTNCTAGAALTPQHTFSGARWCSDQNTLLNCQRKKIGNFRWPKHLGMTKNVNVTIVTAIPSTGTVTITQSASGESVSNITVGGVAIISGAVTAAGSTTSALAVLVRDAINAHVSTPDYTATVSGSVVTLTAVTGGATGDGKAIVATTTQTGTGAASGTITVNSSGNNNDSFVERVQVTGGFTPSPEPTGWPNIMAANCIGTKTDFGNNVDTVTGGAGRRIRADSGTGSSAERNSMALAIASCINQRTASTGYSATSSNNIVTVTAPVATGDLINGKGLTIVKSGTNINYGFGNFSGGTTARVSASTSGTTTGGADPVTGFKDMRAGVGHFSRVDIDPSNDSYPKAAGRVDCTGATCTYAEEMTNFSNWYAYYRTRMQMMKSAAGRAFIPIDDTYRVGLITINSMFDNNGDWTGSVQTARYLRIQDFESVHKGNWYTKFYDQRPSGGTPLREALSRVGRLYAGKFDDINNGIPSADDPMQVSCQPNFAILSTDGYWTTARSGWDDNTNIGHQIDNSDMTQQDNANVGPYSLRSDGVYDGGSSSTVGVADVALYYYQNDLRPAGSMNAASVDVSADNVPTTQQDFAAHQHMTTFTLGLGLDGVLSYRNDYQTATSGDFSGIKQGTINWPNPVQNAPEALDDLWHAAVNGRGVFFSASNPQELANSLSDTLDALKKRVGAGAAAATSNLQPVAGDNFAFTAQYQTQDWIGDLKARTIDLSTGTISAVELWSAQALLNGRDHTDRILFTFDASDAYVSTSNSDVGNQLKHFCMPAAVGIDDWCNDGLGLDAAEQDYFKPSQLPQDVTVSINPLQSPNWTVENLVNYLRGHQTFEDQGTLAATDLFRKRSALLGDIINAQPSYVRASPFSYDDPGYSDFKQCSEGAASVTCPSAQFEDPSIPRRPTVYIAANDGMLHAIETDVNNDPYYQTGGIQTAATGDDTFSGGNNNGNGVERWAYIPGMVLPDMHKLASIPYSHRYFVDGSPTVGDICVSTPCAGLDDWRTILVAGLNSGGRGFYALDVTNPLKPRAMWEFRVRKPSATACAVNSMTTTTTATPLPDTHIVATVSTAVGATDDCDLGLSYGNPVITKLKATGQWVVIVTSGLNNTGPEPSTTDRMGDGKGYLYVLNALTGEILHKIGTDVGDPGTAGATYADADPGGLAKINNWVDDALKDNTTLAVYAGDMKGNLWRFDLDDASPHYLKAVKIAELKNALSTPQPISTKVELGLINSRRVVFVGTGRFLGVSDKADSAKQSIYAIADDLSGHSVVLDRSPLVQQTISNATSTTRTVASVQVVDWTSPTVRGWFTDLPDKGERVSVDPQLQLGTLVVGSNVPSTDTCVAGGTAWINSFDFRTGGYVAGATGNAVSQKITGSVAVGINVIQLPGGKVVTVVTTADNQQLPVETPIAPANFQGKRVGWRELNADQ
jgi:type IV pilus assembly protein PilY1